MKSDIRKAFDTLDWYFLQTVLRGFRFSPTLFNWFHLILVSACLSIITLAGTRFNAQEVCIKGVNFHHSAFGLQKISLVDCLYL